MSNRGIFTFSSTALLIALSAAQSAPHVRVVDLTNTAPNLAEWKIVASGAGGSIGAWPMPPAHVPVTLHLTNCAVRNAGFHFSVEIENNRKLEVRVPISMNSKLFDRRGTITFRELLIQLGKTTNTQDPSAFKRDPNLPSILLFGDQSVPGTIAVLAPGERLVLRLKSEGQFRDQDLGSLRVHMGGFDVTLSPSGDGYSKKEIWIPALFAISESTCSESKQAETSDQLNRPFGKLELHRETVIDGAARLTEASDIGLSVEVPLASSLNAPPPGLEELNTTFDGGRVRDLLDALCELDRTFAWSADGKMVNLFPRKTVSDPAYLFNRRVATLRFSQVRDAGEAVLQAVAQLPAPKEQIAFLQAGGSTAFPTPWSATFNDITIREAFNRIAHQLGPSYGWRLQGSQDFRWIMFHQRLHPRPSQPESK